MRKTLLVAFTFVSVGMANAQLTNLGLNTWASGAPTGWTTPALIATGSVSEITTGAPEGSSAASIKVVACPTCPFIPSSFGGPFPDPMTGFIIQAAEHYTKPTTFSFKWKGQIATGDTGLIAIQFTNMGSVIGEAVLDLDPGTNQATWTTENITINYSGSLMPDTAFIAAIADRWLLTGGAAVSSTATFIDIDDIQLTGGTTGIEMLETNNSLIMAYPNPASDMVNFNLLGTDASVIEVVDMAGNLVYSQTNLDVKFRLDISAYNNGAYFVRFLNNQNEYIGTARFNVAK